MDLNPDALNKILKIFSDELDEQSQVITEGLLKLEKNQDVASTIEIIFRSAHNIKGAARGIGINDIGEIAHHIETLFTHIQNKSLPITRALIDLCLKAVDNMKLALRAYIEKTPLNFDLNLFLSLLKPEQFKLAEKITPSSSDITTSNTNESENTTPSSPINQSETIRVSIESLDRVSALSDEIQVTKIAVTDDHHELKTIKEKISQLEHLWKNIDLSVQQIQQTDSLQAQSLQQQLNEYSDHFIEMNNTIKQLQSNTQRHINELNTLSNTLLDEVRTLRLVPVSTLFNTFPRIVRDIANQLGKQVQLNIMGDATKMDKLVLEGLKDPIIHLLRNAVDHGIENPSIREHHGKPSMGNITIKVKEQGDEILISIIDDGSGIQLESIAKTAISKKLLTEEEQKTVSADHLMNLIFRPGFSTKNQVTDISGRGVGLDVVKSNIDRLKGQVTIETDEHKGSTFTIRVPITLTSERGLLVMCSGQPFFIPTNLISKVLMLNVNDMIEVQSSQAILLDERPIPLRTLADILNLPRKLVAEHNRLPIIVLQKGWHAVALFVEDILNEREIVIKRLEEPSTHIPCVAGGTLASNGQVVIVLNADDLIDRALKITQLTPIIQEEIKEIDTPKRPHILVVDDSITTRTLEKNILESHHYQVTTAVNGKEAWDLLQNQHFSLVITDINMPIMDGFSLTERVKHHNELAKIPVIIVTSLGSEAEKKRGIDAGANAYIVKNEFESDKLLQIVEQLV